VDFRILDRSVDLHVLRLFFTGPPMITNISMQRHKVVDSATRSKDITEQFHIIEQIMIGMMEVAKEPLSNLADNRRSKIGRLNVLMGMKHVKIAVRTDF
jgi:hypothetical protein